MTVTINPQEDPVGYAAAVVREAITCDRQECLDFPRQHTDYAERGLTRARDIINGD